MTEVENKLSLIAFRDLLKEQLDYFVATELTLAAEKKHYEAVELGKHHTDKTKAQWFMAFASARFSSFTKDRIEVTNKQDQELIDILDKVTNLIDNDKLSYVELEPYKGVRLALNTILTEHKQNIEMLRRITERM